MPKVPYNPVPAAPQFIETPRVADVSNPEAFGVGIARSIQQVGAEKERASNELFQRAIAMQQLANDAIAKEADTRFMIESGDLYLKFGQLTGQAAVTAQPQYIAEMKALRERIRSELPNDQSRKMYDGPTLTTFGRTTFAIARHAKDEFRKWNIGTSTARLKATADQALSFPDDDVAFQDMLNKTVVEAESLASGKGFGPGSEGSQQIVAEYVSNLTAKRITGMARAQPQKAQKLLDEARNKGLIRGEQLAAVENNVRQQLHTTGSRILANRVRTGDPDLMNQVPADVKTAKIAFGTFESGNRYDLIGPVTAKGNRAYGKYQVMDFNVGPWTQEALGKAMTPQEFLADKDAQEAVFEMKMGQLLKKYSFNDAASIWHSGVPLAEAIRQGRRDVNISTAEYVQRVNAIRAKHMTQTERVELGRKQAAIEIPNDPIYGDLVTQRIVSDHAVDKRIERDEEIQRIQTIQEAVTTKAPTNPDELKAIGPEVERAYNDLKPTERARVLRWLDRNAKDDYIPTEQTFRRKQELIGMAKSDPIKFLETDIMEEPIPRADRQMLLALRQRLTAKAESDPRVSQALYVLGPVLVPMGITRANNPTRYYQFAGALHDAIQLFQENTKKVPQDKDYQEMGRRLLQEQAAWFTMRSDILGKDLFSIGRGQRLFEVPIPDDAKEIIKRSPMWKDKRRIPTDEEVQRIFTAQEYQRLYGAKPATPSGPSPAHSVPQSK